MKEKAPKRKFRSIWELMYFWLSVAALAFLAWLFVLIAIRELGDALNDFILVFLFYTMPWMFWSFWTPFWIGRTLPELKGGGVFPVIKIFVYTLSMFWVLFILGIQLTAIIYS